ncbi:hypothetical protein BC938DRAFT_478787 [Jimgerdemannia flammicorona]|uniref:Uncharacterized protein n=1 Tax=Jimgerdemannia flammicorona TaxID=994334 RepID=A0A433QM97_9FUNG|nr:hypothetical protein BC938DRAFT_478787 [Jimgerdemannia flammicorona]
MILTFSCLSGVRTDKTTIRVRVVSILLRGHVHQPPDCANVIRPNSRKNPASLSTEINPTLACLFIATTRARWRHARLTCCLSRTFSHDASPSRPPPKTAQGRHWTCVSVQTTFVEQIALRNPTVTLASAFYKCVDGKEIKEAYDNLVKQAVAGMTLTSDLGRDQKPILASWPHHRASTTGTVSSLSKSPNQPGVIDICSWVIDEPRMGGDHVCIRINTPRGKWYSVGQYRPQKMGFHEQFVFSMKIKPIKFTCPDVSEFWRGPHRLRLRNHRKCTHCRMKNPICMILIPDSLFFQEQEFRKMKKQVEQYQPNREYTYQLFHGNCTRYSRSIAEMASTSLPPSSSSSFSSATSRSTTSRGGFSTQSSPPLG